METHFTEVRVCRLLLYLLDRNDIGQPVLEKFFPTFIIKIADIYEVSFIFLNFFESACFSEMLNFDDARRECRPEEHSLDEKGNSLIVHVPVFNGFLQIRQLYQRGKGVGTGKGWKIHFLKKKTNSRFSAIEKFFFFI